MENVIKNLTVVNCLDEVNGMSYGTTLVAYQDDKARSETAEILRIINLISGDEVIRETPDFEGWKETAVEGVFRIIYSDRHNPMPQVTEDDLNVFNCIETAANEKTLVTVTINPALYKMTRKACKEVNVKFDIEEGVVTIDGRKKSQSVYKQIQQAHKNGQPEISFSVEDINAPTVRTYASQFGSAINKKLRCSVNDGKVTVHFKEPETEVVFMASIQRVIDDFTGRLDKDIMDRLIIKLVSPEATQASVAAAEDTWDDEPEGGYRYLGEVDLNIPEVTTPQTTQPEPQIPTTGNNTPDNTTGTADSDDW